jgi:hypothetical protein
LLVEVVEVDLILEMEPLVVALEESYIQLI